MEPASQPQPVQAPNSRIRRAVSRPWDFLKAHLRPVCQYVRRHFTRPSASDDAARTLALARRQAHLQVLQTNFRPDVVQSLQETPWLAAHLAAGGDDAWDESQRTFPDRVAGHVLTRLQMHNFNFVERGQVNLPARSVRHLESIMELVFVEEVARKMAATMREAWVDPEGPSWWGSPQVKLRGNLSNLSKGRTIRQVHFRGRTILKALESAGIAGEFSEWYDLTAGIRVPDASSPNTWMLAMARNLCIYHGTANAYIYKRVNCSESFPDLGSAALSAGTTQIGGIGWHSAPSRKSSRGSVHWGRCCGLHSRSRFA
ncbi:hypothetical protein CGMCC3_g8485 [Colletotrichum fructicola]|uniref:Uncharacterized protein n=1 Tax=Colletotrichum fructicola (strain Nara gc5) TaxID=1213859 RepID=A0A7J6J234_COLFN|nr:uncharacterized protein CGMCC3_g8485 [Colletotrichum fructicola]KAE9575604.1 hypothetical protein CGMCC3_g8485 [Colletotrichum fructicola]KAF4483865.1 hypothetical protein CGGC5_v007431 [Colletotrichum fructicola Nara gc5]